MASIRYGNLALMTVAQKPSRITPALPPPLTPTALGRILAAVLNAGRAVLPALARLIGRMVATIAASSLLVFVLLDVSIPGGFRGVVLPPGQTRGRRARALTEDFHLDGNVIERYFRWLVDAAQGDFGRSFPTGESVTGIIAPRLSISLEIMLVGVAVTLLIGLPLGLLAVALDGRRSGSALNLLLGLSMSIPVYVTPIFLILLFSVKLQWLPASGWTRISDSFSGNLKGLVLPITALILAEVGIVARIVRADVLLVMQSDFIAAARGKGLSSPYILFRHALRPASLGLLNVVALNIGSLLGGALVIELIFGIGALGQILIEAITGRDLYLLLALTTYAAAIYVVLNTIVDGLMLWLDPRTRRR